MLSGTFLEQFAWPHTPDLEVTTSEADARNKDGNSIIADNTTYLRTAAAVVGQQQLVWTVDNEFEGEILRMDIGKAIMLILLSVAVAMVCILEVGASSE